jgi:uncharacterized protein HemX
MTTGEILSALSIISALMFFLWNQIRTSKNTQEAENKRLDKELNETKTKLEVMQEHIKSLPSQRAFTNDFEKFEARLEAKFEQHLKQITELVKATVPERR